MNGMKEKIHYSCDQTHLRLLAALRMKKRDKGTWNIPYFAAAHCTARRIRILTPLDRGPGGCWHPQKLGTRLDQGRIVEPHLGCSCHRQQYSSHSPRLLQDFQKSPAFLMSSFSPKCVFIFPHS